jgi:hypothetical protein
MKREGVEELRTVEDWDGVEAKRETGAKHEMKSIKLLRVQRVREG